MNISLTKHFDDFVQRQVETGRYDNSSEVIRAALRLLEDHDAMTHAKVRGAIDRGLADIKTRIPGPRSVQSVPSFGNSIRGTNRSSMALTNVSALAGESSAIWSQIASRSSLASSVITSCFLRPIACVLHA